MPVAAVVWDIDDTLFDYSGSDRAAALAHLRAEGALDGFGSPRVALRRWQQVMEREYARFTAGELGFLEHRRERARAFLGAAAGDAEADAWFGRYIRRYEAAWRLFPDTLPALDALAPRYRQALLSNSSHANQERKLRALGIRDRFEALVCSAELGVAKPDPRAFLAACAALGLPPEAVAYVGDRADTDAEAARAAGLHGIWLDRGAGEAGGCPSPGAPRIGGLDELPGLLARLG